MEPEVRFDAVAELGEQFKALPGPAPALRRRLLPRSPVALLGFCVTVGAVGTASAAGIASLTDSRQKTVSELTTPAIAPSQLAGYSAVVNGQTRPGPEIPGLKVAIYGTRRGACITVMTPGASAPAGSCFTVGDIEATPPWMSFGDHVLALVPDRATDITATTASGVRRALRPVNNLVTTASRSDRITYEVDGRKLSVLTRPGEGK